MFEFIVLCFIGLFILGYKHSVSEFKKKNKVTCKGLQ